MSENTTEVLVGGAVLAVAGFFLFFAAQTTGFRQASGGAYELSASFRSAEGLSLGTDVRLAGVKVGTVTGLDLNHQTFRADVRFSVSKAIELPNDSAAGGGLRGGFWVARIWNLYRAGHPSTWIPVPKLKTPKGRSA